MMSTGRARRKGRPDARQVEADRLLAGARRDVLRFWLDETGRQRFSHPDRFALGVPGEFKRTVGLGEVVARVRIDLKPVARVAAAGVDLRLECRVVFQLHPRQTRFRYRRLRRLEYPAFPV